MDRSSLKVEAITLRKEGFGINEIAEKLKVRKNTASLWCRPFPLTEGQEELLNTRSKEKGRKGHRLAMQSRIALNLQKVKEIEKIASLEIGTLNTRELFLVGVMLYWAEGFKHKRENALGFSNSDPRLVKVYLLWLKRCLKVKREDLRLRVTANISLKDSVEKFEDFWSKFLEVSRSQFGKPFFQNCVQKKEYPVDKVYYGVLRVYVKGSSLLFKRMRGWIIGLSKISQ